MLENSKYSHWGYILKKKKKGRESCFFLMGNEPIGSDVGLKGW